MYRALDKYEVQARKLTTCSYDASSLKGTPTGMFHCPGCCTMILAGDKHHEVDSLLVLERVAAAFKELEKETRKNCVNIAKTVLSKFVMGTRNAIVKALQDSIGKDTEYNG